MASIDHTLDATDWKVIDRVGLSHEQQVCCNAMWELAEQYLYGDDINMFRTQLLMLSSMFGLRRLSIKQTALLEEANIEVF